MKEKLRTMREKTVIEKPNSLKNLSNCSIRALSMIATSSGEKIKSVPEKDVTHCQNKYQQMESPKKPNSFRKMQNIHQVIHLKLSFIPSF